MKYVTLALSIIIFIGAIFFSVLIALQPLSLVARFAACFLDALMYCIGAITFFLYRLLAEKDP